ncbi:MAG: hypothetical protein AAFR87_07380 [Bacteroidota bacterium]
MERLYVKGIICIAFTFSSIFPLHASPETYDLFGSDEVLKIQLDFDIKQLLKGKYKELYVPASLSLTLENGEQIEESIRVRARGNSRKSYCTLPPLKLNFKNKESKESHFLGQTTLKLVVPCRNSKVFQQYVYKEYLAYKLFNLISDISFKVRLVELNLTDSQGKRKPMQVYGFLIEHIDKLADRNDSHEIEPARFSKKLVERTYMAKVAIFQYAIGNTDWKVENTHNIKVLESNPVANRQVYAVPYDFDYAGLVNASYAVPHDQLGLTSVTQRLYLGVCQSDQELDNLLKEFKAKEDDFLAIVANFKRLDEKSSYYIQRYLADFFRIIDNPALVKRNFLSYCEP